MQSQPCKIVIDVNDLIMKQSLGAITAVQTVYTGWLFEAQMQIESDDLDELLSKDTHCLWGDVPPTWNVQTKCQAMGKRTIRNKTNEW